MTVGRFDSSVFVSHTRIVAGGLHTIVVAQLVVELGQEFLSFASTSDTSCDIAVTIMAVAVIDRLVHHSMIVAIQAERFLKQAEATRI